VHGQKEAGDGPDHPAVGMGSGHEGTAPHQGRDGGEEEVHRCHYTRGQEGPVPGVPVIGLAVDVPVGRDLFGQVRVRGCCDDKGREDERYAQPIGLHLVPPAVLPSQWIIAWKLGKGKASTTSPCRHVPGRLRPANVELLRKRRR